MNEESKQPRNSSIEPELEARIIAMVLGEASDFETEELNRLFQQRPELAAFKRQMENTHGLLNEAGATEFEAPPDEWKLPAGQRNAVLAAIRGDVIAPAAIQGGDSSVLGGMSARRRWRWKLAATLSGVCLAGVVGVMAWSSFIGDQYDSTLVASNQRSPLGVDLAGGTNMTFDVYHEQASPATRRELSRRGEAQVLLRDGATRFSSTVVEGQAPEKRWFEQNGKQNTDAALSAIRDTLGTGPAATDDLDASVADSSIVMPKPGRSTGTWQLESGFSYAEVAEAEEMFGELAISEDEPVFGVQSTKEPAAPPTSGPAVDEPQLIAQNDVWMFKKRGNVSGTAGSAFFDDSQLRFGENDFGLSMADDANVIGDANQDTTWRFRQKTLVPESQVSDGDERLMMGAPVNSTRARPDDVTLSVTPRIIIDEEHEQIILGKELAELADVDGDSILRYDESGGKAANGRGLDNLFDSKERALGRNDTADRKNLDGYVAGDTSAMGFDGGGLDDLSRLSELSDQSGKKQESIAKLDNIDFKTELQTNVESGREAAQRIVAAEKAKLRRQIVVPMDEVVAPGEQRPGNDALGVDAPAAITRSAVPALEAEPEVSYTVEQPVDESIVNRSSRVAGQTPREFSKRTLRYAVPVPLDTLSLLKREQLIELQRESDEVNVATKRFRGRILQTAPPLAEGFKFEKRRAIKQIVTPAGLNEKTAAAEAFSTFSLHVSDVSFKLALAALGKGEWPEAAKVRIEEFVNAFDYGDPMPGDGEKVACAVEQAIHPFLQQRNLLRVSMKTAAAGRASKTPLRLTFLLDNSGSMERIDRQQTVRRAFAALAEQLKPIDQVTLIGFAGQPRLLADKVSGAKAEQLLQIIDELPSEGGTNIEAALQLAFEKSREQQTSNAQNRIILLTDGAVNLGNANPESLSQMVTAMRSTGIAFDAAGISAEGLNDEVLEALTRKGDGRYYLLNSQDAADDEFASQIAGALRPSAKNVKVQVEFNPKRVGRYKLLGFEKHVLKKEDFRNDSVDAAEMAAAEAGVAMYQFEALPDGEGDVGSVSVRFRDLSTGQMIENRWPIPYEANAPRTDQASASIRIAASAALLAAKLKGEPLGASVDLQTLAGLLSGLPERVRGDERIRQLQMMIERARELGR